MNWLFKEEPANYSYDDLARDGKTSWTGVRNTVAQKHLRTVAKGDRIFFYRTGDQKALVGRSGRRRCLPGIPPTPPESSTPPLTLVPVRKLDRRVSSLAVKADKAFATFASTRCSALGHAGHRRGVEAAGSDGPLKPEPPDARVDRRGADSARSISPQP